MGRTSKGQCIPVKNYQGYFDALVFNDADYIEDTIKFCESRSEVDFLLNQPFDYEDDEYNKVVHEHFYKPTIPFHLAVSNNAKDATRILIANGINTQSMDKNGNNVIHSLITASAYVPEQEERLFEMYNWLKGVLGENNLNDLLMSENKDGFRPIEYAAQQGTLLLMQAIFETKGKYVVREEVRGFFSYRWHDVTDYESGPRIWKSPVHLLLHLQKEKLKPQCTFNVINKSSITPWIKAKQGKNLIPAICWFLFRLCLILTFLILDNTSNKLIEQYGENVTLHTCRELLFVVPSGAVSVMIISLSVITTFIIVFYIAEAIHFKFSGKVKIAFDVKGRKNVIANFKFYQLCQLLLCINILFCTGIYTFVNNDGGSLSTVYRVAVVFIPILCSWCLLYFIQALPYFGPSIISIQDMLKDMFSFLGLLLIMIIPFMHIVLQFAQQNSRQGCIEDFSHILPAIYTLFQFMFNKFEMENYDLNNKGILMLIEVIFVFIVAILLINFLVAVMASSAVKVAGNRDIVLTINRLALVCILEERIHWLVPCYYKAMNYMLFNCSDGKVYIVSKTNRVSN